MLVLSVLLLLAPLDAAPSGGSLDRLSEVPSWASPSAAAPSAAPSATASRGGMVDPPTPGGVPAAIPVDGGLALLAAAGLGYGVRRLRRRAAARAA